MWFETARPLSFIMENRRGDGSAKLRILKEEADVIDRYRKDSLIDNLKAETGAPIHHWPDWVANLRNYSESDLISMVIAPGVSETKQQAH